MRSAGLTESGINIDPQQKSIFLYVAVSLYLCACCASESICYGLESIC